METHTVPLPLPVEVVFWAQHPTDSEPHKVRECDVHPVDSRVIYVNKDNIVEVWDYFSRECTLSKPLHDILHAVPQKGTSSVSVPQYARQLTTKQAHSRTFKNGSGSFSYGPPKSEFIRSRQSKTTKAAWGTNFTSSSVVSSSLLSAQEVERQMHVQIDREAAERAHLHELHLQKIGVVKRAVFIDREAIRWTCGVYSQHATRVAQSPLFCDSRDDSATATATTTAPSFHTPHCIMLVCETAIVFYDIQTSRSSAITAIDLGAASKAHPTCAEFICSEMCAIGCSDGCVRIWDCMQWKLVKTLNCPTRSTVHSVKSLMAKNHFSLAAQNGAGQKEGQRMRLLSTQVDGSSLIWESDIFGNMFLIGDDDPTASLSAFSGVHMSQAVDEASDTLFTVSQDRVMRLWDLSSLKTASGGKAFKSPTKATRRGSFLSSKAAAGKDGGSVACIGKVTSSSMTGSAGRYHSIQPLQHPRYPVGTFITASKTNTIDIVQMQERCAGDQASERSSVDGTPPMVLSLIQEVPLARLMAAYAGRILGGNDPEDSRISAREDVSEGLKWRASRDCNVKVYSVVPHPLHVEVLVAATSVGVIVLKIGTPVDTERHVGTHPVWQANNMTLTFGESAVQKCLLQVHGGVVAMKELLDKDDTREGATTSNSGLRDEETRRPQSGRIPSRRISSATVGSSGSSSAGTVLSVNSSAVVAMEVVEEFRVLGTVNGVGTGLTSMKRDSHTSSSMSATHSPLTSVLSSRPLFYPSPSGKFCTVWWPESLFYVVIEVVSSESNRMREVDRGHCYAVAWTSYAGEIKEMASEGGSDEDEDEEKDEEKDEEVVKVSEQDSASTLTSEKVTEAAGAGAGAGAPVGEVVGEPMKEDASLPTTAKQSVTMQKDERDTVTVSQSIDMCTFITPEMTVTSGKDKKGGGIFFKKSKEKSNGTGGVLPSMLLMKDFHSVADSSHPTEIISPTGCPKSFTSMFGGGPLLCITSPVASKDSTNSSNAVSQIELDAAAAIHAEDARPNSSKLNEDIADIPPHVTHKSQFYFLSTDELSEKKSVADKFVLTPIGPAMSTVSMVSWDAPRTTRFTADGADIYTQKVAVLIDSRVNILVVKGVSTVKAGCSRNRSRSRSTSKYKKQSSMSLLFSAAPVLDKISLSCVASCQLGSFPYTTPTSLFWDNGTLFATTPTAVYAVFPLAQSANRRDENSDSGGGGEDNNEEGLEGNSSHGHFVQWGGNMADNFIVTSHTPSSIHSPALPQMIPMPYGHVEVIGVASGQVLLAMKDSSVAAVPLTASPMVAMGMLLQNWTLSLGESDSESSMSVEQVSCAALQWAALLPPNAQDYAMAFIARRLAIQLPSCTLPTPRNSSYSASSLATFLPFLKQLSSTESPFPLPHVSTRTLVEVLVLQLRALNEAVGNINESDLSVDIAEHFARALEMIYNLLMSLAPLTALPMTAHPMGANTTHHSSPSSIASDTLLNVAVLLVARLKKLKKNDIHSDSWSDLTRALQRVLNALVEHSGQSSAAPSKAVARLAFLAHHIHAECGNLGTISSVLSSSEERKDSATDFDQVFGPVCSAPEQ